MTLDEATTAVMGPNGAGKSTLLMALVGVLPFEGAIRVDGEDVSERGRAWRSSVFGYAPQAIQWPAKLSPRQVCETAADLRGVAGDLRGSAVGDALEMAGLTKVANKPSGSLSGGQRRRISLAQAVVHRPKVLVLDEPTSELDPIFCRQFAEIVSVLQADHQLLISTHLLDDVSNWPGDVMLISDGEATLMSSRELSVDRRTAVSDAFSRLERAQ